jgi:(4S)-4-hydroxy-5-phosphonooxypentane-2,3-dione isomerase
MQVIHVHIRVKSEYVQDFITASLENARHSLKEPGIARFDLLQQSADPTRFELIEIYRNPEDPAKHKETSHYNKWRELAEPMLAEPRSRTVYTNVFPVDQDF